MSLALSLQLQRIGRSGIGLFLPSGQPVLINPLALPQADGPEMTVLMSHYDPALCAGLLPSLETAASDKKITIVVNKSLISLLEHKFASIQNHLEFVGLQADEIHCFGSGENQGEITMLDADHHYHVPEHASPFRSNGFLIEHSGHRMYYAGLTRQYSGLKDIGNLYKPNLSILPVGINAGISVDRIAQVVMWLGSDIILPFLADASEDWETVMEEVFTAIDIYSPAICRILDEGEVYDLPPTTSTGRVAGPEARY